MAKFLFLFFDREHDVSDPSEQNQAYNQKWADWMTGLGKEGALEGGLPLNWSGKAVSSDKVEDAKLQEEEDIGGYLLVNADSLDKAAEIAKGAPNVEHGGRVIVRPCEEVPG